MKISELSKISEATRNMSIPVAIGGQTLRVEFSQLLDVLTVSVVPFCCVAPSGLEVTIAHGSTVSDTHIIYDHSTRNFYAAYNCTFDDEGYLTNTSAFYDQWPERSLFYTDDGKIKSDCLFLAENGSIYKFNGNELISAGLTDKQAQQLRLNTPQRVATEEDMEKMIEEGKTVEGQLYYIPEE